MKNLIAMTLCLAAFAFLAGCGEDDCKPCAPIPEQPLAQISHRASGTYAGGSDFLRIMLLYSASADTLVDAVVGEADEGNSLTISSVNNADFDEAVATLTNGVDNSIAIKTMVAGFNIGEIASTSESLILKGGLTGDMYPDLSGSEVTKIIFHIDNVSIQNNETSTDFSVAYRFVFMGRP